MMHTEVDEGLGCVSVSLGVDCGGIIVFLSCLSASPGQREEDEAADDDGTTVSQILNYQDEGRRNERKRNL